MTGVQTCALPICRNLVWCTRDGRIEYNDRILQFEVVDRVMENVQFIEVDRLSDENRGGYSTTGVK